MSRAFAVNPVTTSVSWAYCRGMGDAETRTEQDRLLERTILDLLSRRALSSTICPSDAARAIGGKEWRDLMEPARQAARRLVANGDVDITQGGKVVDGAIARGPIRIRRRAQGSAADSPR